MNKAENRIIRRNSRVPIRFEVECERAGDDVRVTVAPIIPSTVSLLARKQPFQGRGQISEHPTLRVFDEYLANPNGKPQQIGEITHVCIRDRNRIPTRHLLSVVETAKNVMLFPAWGTEPMKPLKPDAQLDGEARVGHITWNKSGAERHLHLSGGARAGTRKEPLGRDVRLKDPTESGFHAARFSIYSLDKLDPLAIPYVRIPPETWGNRDIRTAEVAMNRSLTPNSAASLLPPEWDLAADVHLEAAIGMKQGPFGNDDFARPEKELPQASLVEQVFPIPLQSPWTMVVQLRLIRGRAQRAFGWAPG